MGSLPSPQDGENPSRFPASSPTAAGGNAAASEPGQKPVDLNPFPTTFVHADTSSFKQVVQMLTGSAETAAATASTIFSAPPPPTPQAKNLIPPPGKATGPKKQAFKLYERRGSLRNLKVINPLMPTLASAGGSFSPRKQPEILSPSMLDFPSLVLSPVTPLIPDPFNRSPHPPAGSAAAISAEDRAIAQKSFYLHPSPRSNRQPPQLLSLFPETSP
ncbi:hypothetical protein AXF42_Ash003047 [Apostasia shenzhenica]|uniref:VQ domain-containing protein n=1 Tax=Apostasia shenzhenica TaxID=1088818 RepID=A0A2I0A7Z6_9ASPA|nr:hypothetical protein AXF42_Ash003047 [Apostasia shenzhenica]